MQIDFSGIIQQVADATGKELQPDDIWDRFQQEYLVQGGPVEFIDYSTLPSVNPPGMRDLVSRVRVNGIDHTITGTGNGPIDAFVAALGKDCGIRVSVHDFHEHAIARGSDAAAVAYVSVQQPGQAPVWGVGLHSNIVAASLYAVVSAVNRLKRAV
jgi:2-isopropylmalate synthase